MVVYYDMENDQICFGVLQLEKALNKELNKKQLTEFFGYSDSMCVVSFISGYMENFDEVKLDKEGYYIKVCKNIIYIMGNDYTSLMYGYFDLAEQIKLNGIDNIKTKTVNPYLSMRGIKFNLPYETYGSFGELGDPYKKNIKTCMDIEFWRAYIDFLCLSRYNCLSLWSEHPYHMMFRLDKYPNTNPYSDVLLQRFKNVFKFIFSHCKKRGIKTYIITWNIRLIPEVAKGLMLQEEYGYMSNEHYDDNFKLDYERPNDKRIMYDVRQNSPIVKDYLKECIKTLAISYPDLDGIGTNCAEAMNGDIRSRHEWGSEPYIKGIEESGRKNFDFIIRTNASSCIVAKETFVDNYKSGDIYMSWKYSNAHMYSSVAPKFHELYDAFKDIDLNEAKIVYTLRNDDYYTFRCGTLDFMKEYIKNMKKPHIHGFYWGADGYTWAKDFQHIPSKHMTWEYDFQKHWFQFEIIGRLAYNPNVSDDVWVMKHEEKFGEKYGKRLYELICEAGKILPPMNRVHFENYDNQLHPESFLTKNGFRNIIDVMKSKAMPGENTISILEYVKRTLSKEDVKEENVIDVINLLNKISNNINSMIKEIRLDISFEELTGEIECSLLDFEAWMEIANYYSCKLEAAYYMCLLFETKTENYRKKAVEKLEKALEHWKKLANTWSSHYLPYKMIRMDKYFGYTYYTSDVERDIEIAKRFDSNNIHHVNLFHKEWVYTKMK